MPLKVQQPLPTYTPHIGKKIDTKIVRHPSTIIEVQMVSVDWCK